MAMITAILVSLVVLFLGFVATGLSDHSFSSSRVEHKRVTTFHAAEAGIDHALRLLQSSALAALPCATPLANSLGGGAYAPDYLVGFTYYASYPVAGAPMACPLAGEPAAVVLRSTGGSSDPLGSDRELELVAQLSVPSGVGAFERTVFSDLTVTYEGPVTIDADLAAAKKAELYTNGSFDCDHPQQLAGHVVVQGAATLTNGCTVAGDVVAAGAITTAGKVVIGGNARSSTGDITLTGASTIFGDAEAAGTISVNASSSIVGSQKSGSPTPSPTATALPAVPYDAAAWTAAGYTVVNHGSCPAALTDLATNAAAWATPRVVRVTGCPLDTGSAATIEVKSDVAIVAEQGFRLASSTTFQTPTPGTRLLLIVPYGSSCAGTLGQVVMGTSVTFDPDLEVFVYTPCFLDAHNSGTMRGQIYGGSIRFGAFHLERRHVDGVPGYVPSALSMPRQVKVVAATREVLP